MCWNTNLTEILVTTVFKLHVIVLLLLSEDLLLVYTIEGKATGSTHDIPWATSIRFNL